MKKKVTLVLAALLSVGMILSLTACGGGSAKETVSYKVGTEPTFPPFDTTDEDQNIVGLDMDLIKAIGKDQGFEVTFENLSFDGLIPALKAGNIDIVAAGMNKDDKERQSRWISAMHTMNLSCTSLSQKTITISRALMI